jgi:cell wall-associated NlpC family hydrolase
VPSGALSRQERPESKLGACYVWAAAPAPDTFDRSGLMMWAGKQAS